MLKSIHWVSSSARSSFFEKGIILTKPFQPSQSWHQLSFFEKGIIVQNFLLSEWALGRLYKSFFFSVWQIRNPVFEMDFNNFLEASDYEIFLFFLQSV